SASCGLAPRADCVLASTHLVRVTLEVELEQPVEDLGSRRWTDRVANPLPSVVEAMLELDVVPAVGPGHGVVELDVEAAQLDDVVSVLVPVVDAVVRLG